jgi:hypothetical protein
VQMTRGRMAPVAERSFNIDPTHRQHLNRVERCGTMPRREMRAELLVQPHNMQTR